MIEYFEDQDVVWCQDGNPDGICRILNRLEISRVFLVTGKSSFAKSGAEAFIHSSLNDRTVCRFSEFDPDPSLPDLLRGLDVFNTFSPDCIIAIGGGSVMDMAKLINYFGATQGNPNDVLDDPKTCGHAETLPLIAIPTTSGTGSEATHFSVLYRDGIKHSVAEACMLPPYVILYPDLTRGMNSYQTACTGMDALAQGIESLWAVGATEVSRAYAVHGIQYALENLSEAVNNSSVVSIANMQRAAYWSGRAINISKTTLSHALSYSITSHFGLPHGHAVALTLPSVIKFNLTSMPAVDASLILQVLRADSPGAAKAKIAELILEVGLFCKLSASASDIYSILKNEINIERLSNNPCVVSEDALYKIAYQISNESAFRDDHK